jgi:hypothetical protein
MKWQEQHLEFIAKNSKIMTDKEISITLSKITGFNISIDMIRAQRRRMRITKNQGRPAK